MAKRAAKTTTTEPIAATNRQPGSPTHPIAQHRRKARAHLPTAAAPPAPSDEPVRERSETVAEPRLPSVSVLERRLIDPDQHSSPPVQLKEGGMHLRWINTTAYPGRYSVARSQQGWEPVRIEELADPDEIPELVASTDGLVRRGDRGQEVLMKMPEDFHNRIQRRKVEKRMERERSSRKTKEAMAAAATDRYGPEAGEYIATHMKGEVIETTERIEHRPEQP